MTDGSSSGEEEEEEEFSGFGSSDTDTGDNDWGSTSDDEFGDFGDLEIVLLEPGEAVVQTQKRKEVFECVLVPPPARKRARVSEPKS